MNLTNSRTSIVKLVFLALLTAIVAILAYFGGFVKIGFASISLTLIPVVIGSALLGPMAGAWLGAVAGIVFFATPDAAFWFGLSIPGTIITVIVKGILSGWFAGAAYKVLEKVNRYLAVVVSAVVCPVVNTGIFIIGCFVFFFDMLSGGAASEGMSIGAYVIVVIVSWNFVFELISNVVLSPVITRLINLKKQ